MTYQYIAYNTQKVVVKGKISAASEKEASELMDYVGYQVINLKPYEPFFNLDKLSDSMYQVKAPAIVLLYRQLAMLLESGINIGTSLEMLQAQASNRLLKKVLSKVVFDVRSGTQLSTSLSRHPKIFPSVYCKLLSVGEQSGGLEILLRQVADYMEREDVTIKKTKGALMMPGITAVIAIAVIGLLITFVLPSFGGLYESLGTELPPMARMLISTGEMVRSYGLYLLLSMAAIVGGIILYINTPGGRYNWDKMLLRLPLLGQVRLLTELARFCRSMSLLFQAGMPLNEVMSLIIQGSNSKVLAKALTDVQEDMLKGGGLSGSMSDNKLFLPMMVQMVKVGEETGSLDTTLRAVAQNYEAEAEDKIHSIIGLIQPAMTLIIGGVVGLIAVTLMSAMTSMYGGGF